MEEKFEFIDDFLKYCEDWMHGQDGDDVTKCRSLLTEIQKEFEKLNK
jgi:hypothetical protein